MCKDEDTRFYEKTWCIGVEIVKATYFTKYTRCFNKLLIIDANLVSVFLNLHYTTFVIFYNLMVTEIPNSKLQKCCSKIQSSIQLFY